MLRYCRRLLLRTFNSSNVVCRWSKKALPELKNFCRTVLAISGVSKKRMKSRDYSRFFLNGFLQLLLSVRNLEGTNWSFGTPGSIPERKKAKKTNRAEVTFFLIQFCNLIVTKISFKKVQYLNNSLYRNQNSKQHHETIFCRYIEV